MFFKEKTAFEIAAPMTGTAKPLSQVSDPVFSEKVLGEGVAIIPAEDCVKAPFDGEVVQIAHTFHALVLKNREGVEFLIHLGIDTVRMDEPVFTHLVEAGSRVVQGQELVRINWDTVREHGYSTDSPCIILNGAMVKRLKCHYGEVEAGKTKIMDYYLE